MKNILILAITLACFLSGHAKKYLVETEDNEAETLKEEESGRDYAEEESGRDYEEEESGNQIQTRWEPPTGTTLETLVGTTFNQSLWTGINYKDEVRSVAESNEQFSTKLYDAVKDQKGNLIMSPFSVSAVMAMVISGARGKTLQQIRSGLSFPSTQSLQLGYQDTILSVQSSTDNIVLEAANTIFAMKGFSMLPLFEEIISSTFRASIQTVDFGNNTVAASTINNWVEKITREKIKNLIKPEMLNSLTRLVLVNAIYFKGDWARTARFNRNKTKEQEFSVSSSTTVKVPMMMQKKKFPWAYLEPLNSNMIELPYKGDRIVMQVLLPKTKHGLGELEQKLQNHNVQDLFKKASSVKMVKIQMPRIKLEHTIPLKEILRNLGMKDMFIGGDADFSGIDGTRQLYVSNAVQKAFIEVNEEGSEAAAATKVGLGRFVSLIIGPDFVANHPFIFYIRDKTTGMLLFQGRVVNPLQQ